MAHIADAANTYNSILTGTMDNNIVVFGCVRVWRTDLITKLTVTRWLLTLAIITDQWESGTLGGVTSQKDVRCVENCCAAVAPEAVTQTSSA